MTNGFGATTQLVGAFGISLIGENMDKHTWIWIFVLRSGDAAVSSIHSADLYCHET